MQNQEKKRVVIIGLGAAGQARQRDLVKDPFFELVGSVQRGEDEKFKKFLNDPLIDAFIICSPNASHYDFARQSLLAHKHVLVEFPLARTSQEAKELFLLAREHKKVLHTELIGLLTAEHLALKFAVLSRGLSRIKMIAEGGLKSWVTHELQAKHLSSVLNGRLHSLWSLAGPLKFQNLELLDDQSVYEVKIVLQGGDGQEILLHHKRANSLARKIQCDCFDREGEKIEFDSSPSAGLFAEDLKNFASQLLGGEPYVSDQVVLDVLTLGDQINEAYQKQLESR